MRFDEEVWRRVSGRFKAAGVNQIVIDLGEAVVYPSHPEIAVKGSWSVEKLRRELARLRAMGRVVEFCRRTYDPAHVLGFQMAPWLEMNAVFERRWTESTDMLSSAIGRWSA